MVDSIADGRIGLPYPNGWFAVAFADEVKPGQVVAKRLCGRDLAVWRNEAGEVRVHDAYCMHLGAHLGIGGWVNKDSLVCPFHGWEYGADGRCVRIPYEKRPMKTGVGTWAAREQGQVILAWYDEAGRPPSWEMPELDWTGFATRTREWTLNSHAQEICENTADGAHFRYIHKFPNVMDVEARPDGNSIWFELDIRDEPTAERTAGEPVPFKIKGKADSNVTAVHGPGLAFNEIHANGRIMRNQLYVTHTDLETVVLRGVHSLAFEDDRDAETVIETTKGWAAFDAWDDDIPIWTHKIYRPKPFATHPSEVAIVTYRKWYRRWYSDQPEVEARAAAAAAATTGPPAFS